MPMDRNTCGTKEADGVELNLFIERHLRLYASFGKRQMFLRNQSYTTRENALLGKILDSVLHCGYLACTFLCLHQSESSENYPHPIPFTIKKQGLAEAPRKD